MSIDTRADYRGILILRSFLNSTLTPNLITSPTLKAVHYIASLLTTELLQGYLLSVERRRDCRQCTRNGIGSPWDIGVVRRTCPFA